MPPSWSGALFPVQPNTAVRRVRRLAVPAPKKNVHPAGVASSSSSQWGVTIKPEEQENISEYDTEDKAERIKREISQRVGEVNMASQSDIL